MEAFMLTGCMSCLVLAVAAAQASKAKHRLCSVLPADTARFLFAFNSGSQRRLTTRLLGLILPVLAYLYMRASAAKISLG